MLSIIRNTIYSAWKRGEQLLFQKNVINVVVKNFTQKKVAHRQDYIVKMQQMDEMVK